MAESLKHARPRVSRHSREPPTAPPTHTPLTTPPPTATLTHTPPPTHTPPEPTATLTPDAARVSQLSVLKDVLFLLIKIAVIALAFLLLFTFMFGVFRNPDAAMAPAVKDGDMVIFYRLDKEYAAQDALVLEFEGQKQVRRVVAAAGDVVDITAEGLLVNGALQREPSVNSLTQRYEEGVDFPLTVKEGQVFVLGDSRANAAAADSRIYGAVNVKDTLGKVITILRRRGI
ncbi:MAG: signal peptidase I [Oscillospiraceae bacterium]|jgi:signal peptidase I|nr:signal peptidase I [Oscillospiraceae bacterium]